MARTETPDALAGATGAGKPSHATAAGSLNLATRGGCGNALAHRFAPFAALDPAALAALGLVAGRLWGAVQ